LQGFSARQAGKSLDQTVSNGYAYGF